MSNVDEKSSSNENESSTVGRLEISVRTLTPEVASKLELKIDTKGVVVMGVQAGSVAARAGVRPKDIIVAVGNKDVQTTDDYQNAMKSIKPEQRVHLRSIRDGAKLFVYLRDEEAGTKQ